MAGSRLEKFENIFLRLTGLLKTGAIKGEDKPIWYDVYKTFLPERAPEKLRQVEDVKIRPIFYPEDTIRAKFYKTYGSVGIIDMTNSLRPSVSTNVCERFVNKYNELKANNLNLDEEAIMKMTEDCLNQQGFNFSYEIKSSRKDKDLKIDVIEIMKS